MEIWIFFCYRYDRSKLLTLKYKGLIRLKCDGDMYGFIIIKTKSFNDYYTVYIGSVTGSSHIEILRHITPIQHYTGVILP
ncbi:unnamed protein product [Rhizophagus irregularis]|nr:unnamed protein product [Rhizophagus irregularis]